MSDSYFKPQTKAEREAALKPTANSKESWVTREGMKALKEAVLAEREEVILNGERYHISYGYRRTYPSTHETVDSVRLTRKDGKFVPMGFYPMSLIMAS